MAKILVVEDEPTLLRTLVDNLTFEGYDVFACDHGQQGLSTALTESFDLILLDVMLPGMDGFAFCRQLKKSKPNTPVLFLSARDQVHDVLRGFELGGEDYLKKPFDMAELLVRVKVILRRASPQSDETEQMVFGNFLLSENKMALMKDGKKIPLTVKEFNILLFLVKHRGVAVPREDLLDNVWGYDVFPTTRTVDNYILKLRKLLGTNPDGKSWIESIRGIGYRFLEE